MHTAKISLTIFKFIGIWPEKNSQGFFTIYNFYVFFIITTLFALIVSNLVYTLKQNFTADEFTESFFFSSAIIIDCIKIIVLYRQHKEIYKVTNYINGKQFQPRDSNEISIQNKFYNIERSSTIILSFTIIATCVSKAIFPFVKGLKPSSFFQAWVPYDLENRFFFWLTFVIQNFGLLICGQATVACDTFILALILRICAEIDVLVYRMEIFPEMCKKSFINYSKTEKIVLNEWIQHHESLYRIKDDLNNIYNFVFSLQIIFTTLVSCVMTVQLTTVKIITMKFWSAVMILSAILIQISIMCVSGDLAIEKSRNISTAIFKIDWISLTRSTKLSLVQIILRTNKPIEFTAGRIVPLSIDTLSSILRLAYSIYNCLSRH
ncbi:odorant receptor 67a-like isoform X2 [Leptopilina heterotoma]|uniref:odorant receptor 67a-like isoform X2 n=1 Tax=Leptopilina heterotoma TaxID=63436 RepID=UPI001CA90491|nr:odorant receptor 67a-like isoform X2 [Leptopilina heterotoma]